MKAHQQVEFDFGAKRQERINRALRASPAVTRAVPLSDTDKLMLTCMDSLARQIAEAVQTLPRGQAQPHIASCIAAFVDSLDDVSAEFARETTRYLTDAVARLRQE
jgi:hypothetical protein